MALKLVIDLVYTMLNSSRMRKYSIMANDFVPVTENKPTATDRPVPNDKEVELARITSHGFEVREKYNFFRLVAQCICFTLGLLILCATYLQATKPAWITALGMILAACTPAIVAVCATFRIQFAETRRLRKRIINLEANIVAKAETIKLLSAQITILEQELNSKHGTHLKVALEKKCQKEMTFLTSPPSAIPTAIIEDNSQTGEGSDAD